MDEIEYLDIVDINDSVIGKKPRTEIIKDDIYRVSSLWVFDKEKNLLIAQRPMWKKHDPGKWTESAVGTVPHGETYEQTLIREAKEELGLELIDLIFISKQFHESINEKMFGAMYAVLLKDVTPHINNEPNEVPAVEWVSHDELIREYSNNDGRFVDGLDKFYIDAWDVISKLN